MGGAWRDDHPDNIQAVHRHCNLRKGSVRIAAPTLIQQGWLLIRANTQAMVNARSQH